MDNNRIKGRNFPLKLKDGYYIEVCDVGHTKGMMIRSESKKAMEDSVKFYKPFKHVIVLGEYKDGEQVAKQS
jgi:hypothetical protein